MILDRILKHKRREVKDKKNARYLADLKTKIRDAPAPIGFYQALAGPPRSTTIPTVESPRLIAEVKKASPSRGVLCENLDRKSTRLNSSHSQISYAVFCLK